MTAAMRRHSKPPILLGGGLVEQFAVCDQSIVFRGQRMVFSGGNEVGPVPKLALVRSHGEVLLVLCDQEWGCVAIGSTGVGIRAVKKRAERMYLGISRLWKKTGYTRTQARAILRRRGLGDQCAVCRKRWYDVEQMVTAKAVSICDHCVRDMYALLQEPGDSSAA
jgi:hypothetical protein